MERTINSKIYVLGTQIDKDLTALSEIMDKEEIEILQEAVEQYIQPYRNQNGELKAFYGCYEVNGEEKECKILGAITLFGQPYLKVLVDGKMTKVPKDLIKILD